MKTFLNDLRNALKNKNISAIEIEDIIKDHEDMIEEAKSEGLSEEEILTKLGKPEEIAEGLADFEEKDTSTETQKTQHILKEFEVQSTSIDVSVSMSTETTEYKLVDSKSIRVLCRSNKEPSGYEVSFKNDTLKVEAPKLTQFLSFLSRGKGIEFIIEIPKSLAINHFKHSTLSGDVHLDGFNIKHLEMNTVSGDIKVSKLEITEAQWYTVSGDITLDKSRLSSLKSSQVSGDLFVLSSAIEEYIDLDTVSGDMYLEDSKADSCKVNSVSGDVRGKEFYPNKISLSSISGNINIKNQEKRHIEIISRSTLSGSIHIHT